MHGQAKTFISLIMKNRRAPIFLLLLLLSGCAGLTPTLSPSVPVEPDSAYISGLFNRSKGSNFAFVIRSVDGKNEYVMPMGEDKALPSNLINSSITIKVVPGTYSLSQWITYATLSKDVITRKEIDNKVFSKPFIVKAGSVTHLGIFSVGSVTSNGGFNGYGLRCYLYPQREAERICFNWEPRNGEEKIILDITDPPFPDWMKFPMMQARYFTPSYGGLHVLWRSHIKNLPYWHEIDTQIWKYIDEWNIAPKKNK